MGKNLIQQRRGKGSPTYKAPSHRYHGEAKYRSVNKGILNGKILDIVKCPGHSSPLAKIDFDTGGTSLMIAPEGVRVGRNIQIGETAEVKRGNILPLKNIPEGTAIFNIENMPGDGGKFIRSTGTFGKITMKMEDKIIVQLPSKKKKTFNPNCRASIGIIAGSGRKEKPFLKAGRKYHAMRARNKLYPGVSGTSMNAVDHPFGGTKSSHKGKSGTTSRHAPPGRKVGRIAASRTGRKKR